MPERTSSSTSGTTRDRDAYTSSPRPSEPRGGGDGTGIVDRVRERATAQLSSQKDKATEGLGSVATAVRQTTQTLRDQHHDTVAHYVEQAADQIERFSQRLKQKDVTELLEDAQQLARRQPALFIGGAFAIGVAGARFLKSSSPRGGREGYDLRRSSESYDSTLRRESWSSAGAAITEPSTAAGRDRGAGSTADAGNDLSRRETF